MEDTVPALALRESEELHRIILLSMSDAVFITDDEGVFTFICPNADVIFGYSFDEVRAFNRISRLLGRELVEPQQLKQTGEIRNIEHDIETKSGTRRSLLVHVKPVSIKGGTILYVCRDITDRKQAEEALHHMDQELRDLGGRLINAHEGERIRLSHDLHDDVGQRVSLLEAELGILGHRLADAAPDVRQQVAVLSEQAEAIGSELSRLSHELHPVRLTLIGLEESIRTYCRDVAEAHQIAIDADVMEVSAALGSDEALCLYRITQEAVHNVVKHSSATRTTVTLIGSSGKVLLSIVDNGVGFDTQAARKKDTLGLVSMRERARLVRGTLMLTSEPGGGTRIDVSVPVAGS